MAELRHLRLEYLCRLRARICGLKVFGEEASGVQLLLAKVSVGCVALRVACRLWCCGSGCRLGSALLLACARRSRHRRGRRGWRRLRGATIRRLQVTAVANRCLSGRGIVHTHRALRRGCGLAGRTRAGTGLCRAWLLLTLLSLRL